MIQDCTKHPFEGYYTSPEVASAFASFYANDHGILDRFMDFWTVVAKRFENNNFVLGYDILNEPWPANLFHDLSLLLDQTKFDSEILYPLT